MKIKSLNFLVVLIIQFAFFSCLKSDGPSVRERTEAEEINLIDTYIEWLENMGNDVDTTELGVFYITLEEGEGAFASDGDTISIGFAGYLIDEALFVSAQSLDVGGDEKFVLGEVETISGWDDGLRHVKEGGKIYFIVPSWLAYGDTGEGKIGPYQTLVFVVRLYELGKLTE